MNTPISTSGLADTRFESHARQASQQQVKVWDPLVRVFHWTLVTAFFVAYFTEDDLLDLHVYAGYLIGGLLVFRLVWGFVGSRHARFTDFVKRPSTVWAYLKSLVGQHPRRYLGHNPAGGAMVIALLVSLLITTLSGVAIYGVGESAGPLAASLSGVSDFWADVLEETHEFFANFTLGLVFFHVLGVLLASLQHRENLVKSMVNGFKEKQTEGEDA
jgi:cytochrome b